MVGLPFIKQQVTQIREGGIDVVIRKLKRFCIVLLNVPFYILGIPAIIIIRLIRPWLLIRMGGIISSRIGHFAANTELYLCERDANINQPAQRFVDLLYYAYKPISNRQLATMWKRVLTIWPTWLIAPIHWLNRKIPGGEIHEVGQNTQCRDPPQRPGYA